MITITTAPTIILVHWGRYRARDIDGWLFTYRGQPDEPCAERAWQLGPLPENAKRVAAIMACDAQLPLTIAKHPRSPRWAYIYWLGRGSGEWMTMHEFIGGGAKMHTVGAAIDALAS